MGAEDRIARCSTACRRGFFLLLHCVRVSWVVAVLPTLGISHAAACNCWAGGPESELVRAFAASSFASLKGRAGGSVDAAAAGIRTWIAGGASVCADLRRDICAAFFHEGLCAVHIPK